MNEETRARAKAIIAKMTENAKALTEALGLPPEAMPTVLETVYKDGKYLPEISEQDISEHTQLVKNTYEEALKTLIFQFSEGFFKILRSGTYLSQFYSLWKSIQHDPIEYFMEGYNQGFLRGMIFLISWSVINHSLIATKTSQQIATILEHVAWADEYSLSPIELAALADYLQRELQSKLQPTSRNLIREIKQQKHREITLYNRSPYGAFGKKGIIRFLADDFRLRYLSIDLQTFNELWRVIEVLPIWVLLSYSRLIETLLAISDFENKDFATASNHQLLSIISTMSWTVIHWGNLWNNPYEKNKSYIFREAKERGCSPQISHTLALYLIEQLSDILRYHYGSAPLKKP